MNDYFQQVKLDNLNRRNAADSGDLEYDDNVAPSPAEEARRKEYGAKQRNTMMDVAVGIMAREAADGPLLASFQGGGGDSRSGSKRDRIELVMSERRLKFGRAYTKVDGFSFGVPEAEDSFLHNEYPVRAGVGVLPITHIFRMRD